jgi:hypothetical protein
VNFSVGEKKKKNFLIADYSYSKKIKNPGMAAGSFFINIYLFPLPSEREPHHPVFFNT